MVDEMTPDRPGVRGPDRRVRPPSTTTTGSASTRPAPCASRSPSVRATAEQMLDEFEKVQCAHRPGRRWRWRRPPTSIAVADAPGPAAKPPHRRRLDRAGSPNCARPRAAWSPSRSCATSTSRGIDELAAELDRRARPPRHSGPSPSCSASDAFTGYHAERRAARRATPPRSPPSPRPRPSRERLDEQADGLQVLTEVVGALDIARRHRAHRHPGADRRGARRRQPRARHPRRPPQGAAGRRGPRRVRAPSSRCSARRSPARSPSPTRPRGCDEQLGRLMLQLEELEARFGEFDDFLGQLAPSARRSTRRSPPASRRCWTSGHGAPNGWSTSAERILGSVARRAADARRRRRVNTYFASDPMVQKLRGIAERAARPGRQVRAEELTGALKAARQEAGRALRDRPDLFTDGGDTHPARPAPLRGQHPAARPHAGPAGDGELAFASPAPTTLRGPRRRLRGRPEPSGTSARRRRRRRCTAPSTSRDPARRRGDGRSGCREAARPAGPARARCGHAAEQRYDEGYERGVHDHDAARSSRRLLALHAGAGLLRFRRRRARAAALYWACGAGRRGRVALAARAGSLARARAPFGRPRRPSTSWSDELAGAIGGLPRSQRPAARSAR